MDFTTGQILLGIAVLLLTCLFLGRRRPRGMPPGPLSFPIIGSLLSLRGDVREAILRLRNRYGDMLTLDLGSRRTVMLVSYDAIKEALVKNHQSFSDRPQDLLFMTEVTQGMGIVSPNGRLWKEHRKFAQAVFREFGVGRPIFEERIREEIFHMLRVFRKSAGLAYDPSLTLQMAISNVLNHVIFGKRYDYEDPKFIDFMRINNMSFEMLGNTGILTVFPFLKYLPGDLFHFKRLRASSDYVNGEFKADFEEHRLSHRPGVVNDFIDAYFEEAAKEEHKTDTTFTDEQLLHVVGDLFGAGSETTATTLRWALLFLMTYPDVQSRLQQEIDEALAGTAPSVRDRSKLPYMEAFLREVQRVGDIVPLGVPHMVSQDTDFRGYHIPAGTTIMTILYAAHRDPSVWEEPYLFKPERFLDEDGLLNKSEKLIPFSMGKRVCLGESLARMELFLFMTALVQEFTFKSPPKQTLPGINGVLGITHGPHPFKVIAKVRS